MSKNGGFTRTQVLIVLAIAEGILTAILAVIFLFPKPYAMSWGEEIDRRENYVYVENQTLTQKDLETIASIKTLRYLRLTDCNVAECRLPELRFASRELRDVDLSGTEGLWDLSFLSNLQAERLTLSRCKGIEDLSVLNFGVLENLDVSNTAVSDLSPLAGSQLMSIDFSHTNVSDLTPLTSMNDLWEVDGSYTKVSSLEPLAQNRGIWRIHFDGCPITEFPSNLAASYMDEVSLAHTQITDLSGLAGVRGPSELNIAGNPQITDLSWVDEDMCESLDKLNVGMTGLTADDLGWLRSCPNLRELTLDGIELGNLDMCRAMHNLSSISALGCGLTDVSGIKNCSELEGILLGYNHVTDLTDLPRPSDEWPSMEVDLSHNGLTSLDGLPAGSYRCLLLHGNNLDYTRKMLQGVDCYSTIVSWGEGIEKSVLTDSYRFSDVYLLDCPPSEFGTVDKAFGSFQLTRITKDELLYRLRNDGFSYSVYGDYKGYVEYAESRGDGDADAGEKLAEGTADKDQTKAEGEAATEEVAKDETAVSPDDKE